MPFSWIDVALCIPPAAVIVMIAGGIWAGVSLFFGEVLG